jgi:hypothetical protein
MQQSKTKKMKAHFLPFLFAVLMVACSKSNNGSSSNNNGGGGNNITGNSGTTANGNGAGLWPLAQNNVWNYRLKTYNTTTGALLDSSDFTLTVTGTMSANGATYYKVVNSSNGSAQWLTNLNGTTVGSIDSSNGVNYYTAFVSSTGDSTKVLSTWSVSLTNSNGGCLGSNHLYGNYADTTLIDLDGTVYSSSIKNDVVTYDCMGSKSTASAYFVKQGLGLVRLAGYVYDANGDLHLALAWVLESSTLH